jgi:hypothetical protein
VHKINLLTAVQAAVFTALNLILTIAASNITTGHGSSFKEGKTAVGLRHHDLPQEVP